MLEKFNHLAQAAATNVSRRQMFGQLGRAAAAAAAVLAGFLPSSAEAGLGRGKCSQCGYQCPDGSIFEITHRGPCRSKRDGCILFFAETGPCGGGV